MAEKDRKGQREDCYYRFQLASSKVQMFKLSTSERAVLALQLYLHIHVDAPKASLVPVADRELGQVWFLGHEPIHVLELWAAQCDRAALAVEAKSPQAIWGIGDLHEARRVVFVGIVVEEVDAQSGEPGQSFQRGQGNRAARGERELGQRVHGAEAGASCICETGALGDHQGGESRTGLMSLISS